MTIQDIIESGCDTRQRAEHPDALVDERTAAAIIDVAPGTLSVWRSTGRYELPFLKIGRKVRYRRTDLEAWLAKRTRQSGSTA